jgi:hypothetical protein
MLCVLAGCAGSSSGQSGAGGMGGTVSGGRGGGGGRGGQGVAGGTAGDGGSAGGATAGTGGAAGSAGSGGSGGAPDAAETGAGGTGGVAGSGGSGGAGGNPAALPAFCKSYPPPAVAGQWRSAHVGYQDGKLVYVADAGKNRIPDFSYAGYRYGEEAPPQVPEVARLQATAGDNTARIQQALDMVGARMPDARGIRGALVLAPGRYEIAGTLKVDKSGVVLRGSGEGEDPASATILFATGEVPHQRTVVVLGSGAGSWPEAGGRTSITTPFVQVGSRSFDLESATGLAVGDNIVVHHPSTAAWIQAVEGGGTGKDPPWAPGSMDIRFNRRITAITGTTVTVDAPVFNHLDRALSQSYVAKLTANFATHVGLENLRVDVQTAGGEDENHAWSTVGFVGAQDAWARDVTTLHWGYAGVRLQWSVRVTLDNFKAFDPVAVRTGGRMYNIAPDHGSQLILVRNCQTSNGRHALVSNGNTVASGLVYHRCKMVRGDDVEAGHKRWVQGVLFDNVEETAGNATYILLGNRGDWGTQHGWAAAHSVIWNFNAQMIVQKPPTAQNYAVSERGSRRDPIFAGPDGSFEIKGPGLTPASLYEAQLCERLAARDRAAQ